MSESFSVGEIAIVFGLVHWPEDNGSEVEIAGPLLRNEPTREIRTGHIGYYDGHLVVWANGLHTFQPLFTLRKRPPRQDWLKLSHLTDVPREVTHV